MVLLGFSHIPSTHVPVPSPFEEGPTLVFSTGAPLKFQPSFAARVSLLIQTFFLCISNLF